MASQEIMVTTVINKWCQIKDLQISRPFNHAEEEVEKMAKNVVDTYPRAMRTNGGNINSRINITNIRDIMGVGKNHTKKRNWILGIKCKINEGEYGYYQKRKFSIKERCTYT